MRMTLDIDEDLLIAVLDAEHLHHEAARRWLRDNIQHGWATCPITQNGCLRIMAQTGYSNTLPASLVAQRLREATATDHHRFWPDEVTLLDADIVDWTRMIGAKQIADIYLLALAVRRGGRFATFDARVASNTVPGATQGVSA